MRFHRFLAPLIFLSMLGMQPCHQALGASRNTDELAQTLDDFRERYFVANNGRDKMLSMQSMRVDAILSLPDGREGKIIFIKQKPNFVRSVWYGPRGVVIRKGFNGVTSWETVKTPDGQEKGSITKDAPPDVFEWVIASPESCGATLEMLPVERSDRSENYHIRATLGDGTVKDYYLDVVTFCESKVVEKSKDGKITTYIIENPQKFDGIWFPGVQTGYDESGKVVGRVEIKDIQMNIGLLPCFFDSPVALQEKIDENAAQPAQAAGK